MPTYSLEFRDWSPSPEPDGAARPVFIVKRDGEYLFPAAVSMRNSAIGNLMERLGSDDARDRVEEALLRWSVRRIEEGVRTGELLPAASTNEFRMIEVLEEDERAVGALVFAKDCRYRVQSGREAYCSAAARTDETVVGSTDVKWLAPTSVAVCRGCALPASDFICEHLVHPQVTGVVTMGGGWSRFLGSALCEAGRSEVKDPSLCRAGGHTCWARIAPAEQDEPAAAAPPMALPETFDFLDAIWRLKFGGRPLLRMASAKDVAGIAQPCASRSDFEEHVTDLADLITTLNVADDDLPGHLSDYERDGSLNRLEAALRARLDRDGLERAVGAISVLRRVITIRNGFGHSGAAKKLPNAFADLGLAYPPQSWTLAWAHVRGRVVSALTRLREEIAASSR